MKRNFSTDKITRHLWAGNKPLASFGGAETGAVRPRDLLTPPRSPARISHNALLLGIGGPWDAPTCTPARRSGEQAPPRVLAPQSTGSRTEPWGTPLPPVRHVDSVGPAGSHVPAIGP